MRILMHDNYLSERGTTNALHKYSEGLAELGHDVTIAFDESSSANDRQVVSKLGRDFELHGYTSFASLEACQHRWDVSYFIKSGANDGKFFRKVPSFIHVVFQSYDPHGASYQYVSEWLANQMRTRSGLPLAKIRTRRAKSHGCRDAGSYLWLPHVADMPTPDNDPRSEYGIPSDAFLMLRYGGFDTFDIDWVHDRIVDHLRTHPSSFFLGVNTKAFTNHPRALFVPAIYEDQRKADLLSSAQVFIHARSGGESFGISILEALQTGVPVLSWSGGKDKNHQLMLKETGALFDTPAEFSHKLYDLLLGNPDFGYSRRIDMGNRFRPKDVILELEMKLKALTVP